MRKNIALINIFIKRIYFNKSAKSIIAFTKYTISNILKSKKKKKNLKDCKNKISILYY